MTIVAIDNDVDAPDKAFTVSATVDGGRVSDPPSLALTITDDEETPTVTLHLSPSPIDENGGVASVTASLSWPSSEAVTVAVSASPAPPASAGDFNISSNKTLTIAPRPDLQHGRGHHHGRRQRLGRAGQDRHRLGGRQRRRGERTSTLELTITDDEGAPTVTLHLSPSSIGENGGSAHVTASLSAPPPKP